MACTLLTSLIVLLVCIAVVLGAAGDIGEACKTTSPTCTDTTKAVCDNNLCKVKVDGSCSASSSSCVSYAVCNSTTNSCKCNTGWTASATGTCVSTAGDIGQRCKTTTSTCTDTDKAVCENNVCKVKVDGSCSGYPTLCVSNAGCNSTTNTCKCDSGSTALATGTCGVLGDIGQQCKTTTPTCTDTARAVCDNNLCKVKVDGSCSGYTTSCVSYAGCNSTTNTCKCNTGWTASATGTCDGASGVTASVILLLAGLLVTSRFL